MWPDPLGTGAYRLEIISATPQGSGLVHIPNLFWPQNRCKTSVTHFVSLLVICALFWCLLDLVFSNDPYGPTAFETEAFGTFGAFYWGEDTFVVLPTGYCKSIIFAVLQGGVQSK